MKTFLLCLRTACALALALAATARTPAAQISETEAVTIAEWWYTCEINAPTTRLREPEKQERLAARTRHQIHAVIARDRFTGKAKVQVPISAYVVTFEPAGFVVVSGDDALQPVLAFSTEGSYRGETAERSYLSHFAGRAIVSAVDRVRTARRRGEPTPPHARWSYVRTGWRDNPGPSAQFALPAAPAAPAGPGIFVQLPTAWWNQGMYYNNVCVAHCGGQFVWTGCTATAMAIKFRYHQWPLSGNGSHSYSDSVGGTSYQHSVNFSAHSYNWTAMPTNDLTANNADVAGLMYDCGVAVGMDYDPDGSAAWPSTGVFNNNFRYRGTSEISSGTASDHLAAMAYSIRCGLPTVMCSSTHCVVACGYRDSVAPYFYLNGGHGHSDDGWYDLDQLGWDDKTIDRSYPYSSPDHFAYVDSGHTGSETGDLQAPYATVAAGQAGVTTGGLLLLKGGHYVGPGNTGITLSKTMTLTNYLGPVTIGP